MRRLVASIAVLLLAFSAASGSADGTPKIAGAELVPVPFGSLKDWANDDHLSAFRTLQRSCAAIVDASGPARSAVPPSDALIAACREAVARTKMDPAGARSFFESRFTPFDVVVPAGRGFLTGYYEPELPGSVERTQLFAAPLLSRPDDLVTLDPKEVAPGLPPGLSAARRGPAGLEPYPERAAIEDGAIADRAAPILYLRDAVDVFIAQVQGSARIKLTDGRAVRVGYAGRNGHPYTSVARLLVQRLGIAPGEMTADVLTTWLRAHPTEARDLLRENRSYVFFRLMGDLRADEGPIGAAGVPVDPGRSLAIDRSIWSYGLPIWLEGIMPEPGGGQASLRRLVVAQDTGSAILGAARGDLFFGSGEGPGQRAGLLRSEVRFVVLWPRQESGAAPR